MEQSNYCYTQSQVALMNQLRKLWEQHVQWTRSFIISTAADLPDLDLVTQRLLRNPDDFTKLLGMFYGPEIAKEFGRLLKEHLQIAADLVNAIKRNDMRVADEVRQKWYRNADEIARFLAKINPYWNEQEWKNLLYSHLQMVEEEARLRLEGNFAADIQLSDRIEAQALDMADYMLYGMVNQFSIR